jgi:hypothetical protein
MAVTGRPSALEKAMELPDALFSGDVDPAGGDRSP